jgi:hypothetical protein
MDPMVRRISIEHCLNLALFVNSVNSFLYILIPYSYSDSTNLTILTLFCTRGLETDKKHYSPLLFKIGNRQI